MPMKMEELRGLLIKALKQGGWNQVTSIEIAVGNLKARLLGLDSTQRYATDGRAYLEPGESSLIHELVWTFIVQGILVPGFNDSNQAWPFLRLTDYGRRSIEAEGPLPHDPEGYLAKFQSEVPQAAPVVVEYLIEALQCFLRDLQRAAAVMLGAASEAAVLQLIDCYGNAISDPSRKAQIATQLAKSNSVFQKFKLFEKGFGTARLQLPPHLSDNTDSLLRGVFDLIRNNRNEAGHPASGIEISRDTNYSHLRLFIPYCQRVYQLADWFTLNLI